MTYTEISKSYVSKLFLCTHYDLMDGGCEVASLLSNTVKFTDTYDIKTPRKKRTDTHTAHTHTHIQTKHAKTIVYFIYVYV